MKIKNIIFKEKIHVNSRQLNELTTRNVRLKEKNSKERSNKKNQSSIKKYKKNLESTRVNFTNPFLE
jgi:hypothetical protein